jgi:hypothetical protein
VISIGSDRQTFVLEYSILDGIQRRTVNRSDARIVPLGTHEQRLPPGFNALPSSTRPGQLAFVDALTGMKYGTFDLAWRIHLERVRASVDSCGQPTINEILGGAVPANQKHFAWPTSQDALDGGADAEDTEPPCAAANGVHEPPCTASADDVKASSCPVAVSRVAAPREMLATAARIAALEGALNESRAHVTLLEDVVQAKNDELEELKSKALVTEPDAPGANTNTLGTTLSFSLDSLGSTLLPCMPFESVLSSSDVETTSVVQAPVAETTVQAGVAARSESKRYDELQRRAAQQAADEAARREAEQRQAARCEAARREVEQQRLASRAAARQVAEVETEDNTYAKLQVEPQSSGAGFASPGVRPHIPQVSPLVRECVYGRCFGSPFSSTPKRSTPKRSNSLKATISPVKSPTTFAVSRAARPLPRAKSPKGSSAVRSNTPSTPRWRDVGVSGKPCPGAAQWETTYRTHFSP